MQGSASSLVVVGLLGEQGSPTGEAGMAGRGKSQLLQVMRGA